MRRGAPEARGASRRARWHPRGMLSRIFLIALALLTVTACGSGGASATSTTSATQGAAAVATPGAGAAAGLRLVRVGTFEMPVLATAPPADRDRVIVVEQEGRIRVVRDGRVLDRPFLDIRSRVTAGGEQGLLGLAFAPDYARERPLLRLLHRSRLRGRRVVEYRRGASADRRRRRLARAPCCAWPTRSPTTTAASSRSAPTACSTSGPATAAAATTSTGGAATPRTSASLLGKILRIDPRAVGRPAVHASRAGNPFVGRAGRAAEIYAYGLRNPWRFSFDREHRRPRDRRRRAGRGRGDRLRPPRPRAGRELRLAAAARARRRNFREPRARRGPPGPHQAPRATAGARSPAATSCATRAAAARGRYVYGDFCKGQLRAARLRAGGARNDRALRLPNVPSLSSFGEDARGRVYVMSLDGPVYRIAAALIRRCGRRRAARARGRARASRTPGGRVRSASSARSRSRAISAASGTTSASA